MQHRLHPDAVSAGPQTDSEEVAVSVVVPVYNAERVIPRLMASLRAQDYRRDRVEVILVERVLVGADRENPLTVQWILYLRGYPRNAQLRDL